MSGFDIQALLRFQPARYYCVKCLALTCEIATSGPGVGRTRDGRVECSVCKVEYTPTSSYSASDVASYLSDMSYHIRTAEILKQAQLLAAIAKNARRRDPKYPPLRCLLEAFSRAESFIHFTTASISRVLVGALKLTAQRIPVRGVVTNIDASLLTELMDYREEAPGLSVKVHSPDADETKRLHPNLIVIDGLLAFKGPANLTMSEWRRAALKTDLEVVVTDVEEIIDLHNLYFSPLWKGMSMIGDTITMDFPH